MMTYITVTLNHFRAVKAWAEKNQGDAKLDIATFRLEVKARNRYYTLLPRFLSVKDGSFGHHPTLTPDAVGFIGWLPYATLNWELSSDKLAFKRFISTAGLQTPPTWNDPAQASRDYVLKCPSGSFGYQLFGPFSAKQPAPALPAPDGLRGPLFAEEFIHGTNIKVWCWGETPFYAQVQDYARLTGDGASTLNDMLIKRFDSIGRNFEESRDRDAVLSSLAYQGHQPGNVLTAGQSIWIDYRYGRHYTPVQATPDSDNQLASLDAGAIEQVNRAAQLLGAELMKQFAAPVLYSMDAVQDASGRIWWLEMNSNPILPPEGYTQVFETLFGPGTPA